MQVASERAMALELPWFSTMGTPYRTQKGIPFFERYLRTELIIHHLADCSFSYVTIRQAAKVTVLFGKCYSTSHLGAGM